METIKIWVFNWGPIVALILFGVTTCKVVFEKTKDKFIVLGLVLALTFIGFWVLKSTDRKGKEQQYLTFQVNSLKANTKILEDLVVPAISANTKVMGELGGIIDANTVAFRANTSESKANAAVLKNDVVPALTSISAELKTSREMSDKANEVVVEHLGSIADQAKFSASAGDSVARILRERARAASEDEAIRRILSSATSYEILFYEQKVRAAKKYLADMYDQHERVIEGAVGLGETSVIDVRESRIEVIRTEAAYDKAVEGLNFFAADPVLKEDVRSLSDDKIEHLLQQLVPVSEMKATQPEPQEALATPNEDHSSAAPQAKVDYSSDGRVLYPPIEVGGEHVTSVTVTRRATGADPSRWITPNAWRPPTPSPGSVEVDGGVTHLKDHSSGLDDLNILRNRTALKKAVWYDGSGKVSTYQSCYRTGRVFTFVGGELDGKHVADTLIRPLGDENIHLDLDSKTSSSHEDEVNDSFKRKIQQHRTMRKGGE